MGKVILALALCFIFMFGASFFFGCWEAYPNPHSTKERLINSVLFTGAVSCIVSSIVSGITTIILLLIHFSA